MTWHESLVSDIMTLTKRLQFDEAYDYAEPSPWQTEKHMQKKND